MDIYNYKSVPGLSTPEILITSSERKKILQYSKKILASFPDYYGLISGFHIGLMKIKFMLMK